VTKVAGITASYARRKLLKIPTDYRALFHSEDYWQIALILFQMNEIEFVGLFIVRLSLPAFLSAA
jgi:hypothetical protein